MIRLLGRDNSSKYTSMSSNLRVVKICAFCKQEFIARKTTTETCSASQCVAADFEEVGCCGKGQVEEGRE